MCGEHSVAPIRWRTASTERNRTVRHQTAWESPLEVQSFTGLAERLGGKLLVALEYDAAFAFLMQKWLFYSQRYTAEVRALWRVFAVASVLQQVAALQRKLHGAGACAAGARARSERVGDWRSGAAARQSQSQSAPEAVRLSIHCRGRSAPPAANTH